MVTVVELEVDFVVSVVFVSGPLGEVSVLLPGSNIPETSGLVGVVLASVFVVVVLALVLVSVPLGGSFPRGSDSA